MAIFRFNPICFSALALLACSQKTVKDQHHVHGEIGGYSGWSGQPSMAYIDREPQLYGNLGRLHNRGITAN